MKPILLSIFICIAATVTAQTDSTEIKLQHYKDLFIKGLISSQEYETLKGQVLGLPKSQPTTIIVQQQKPKPEIDSVQAKHLKNKYTGNIAAGVGGIVLGVGLITGGAIYYENRYKEIVGYSVDGSSEARAIRTLRIVSGMMIGFGSASLVLGVTGLSVGLTQRNKVKKYENSLSFNLSLSQIGFAYNF